MFFEPVPSVGKPLLDACADETIGTVPRVYIPFNLLIQLLQGGRTVGHPHTGSKVSGVKLTAFHCSFSLPFYLVFESAEFHRCGFFPC